jgi:RNA polymerase sigma-70 factor (ECF subfamily)
LSFAPTQVAGPRELLLQLLLSTGVGPAACATTRRGGPGGPDRELVARALRGDRGAFDQIFERHADDVFRWLTRLLGPVPEREDLLQEVFLAAFKGLATFRGDAALSTWLYRIVANTAYSRLRSRRRRPVDWRGAAHELALDRALDGAPSPEAAAQQRQQVQLALELLDRLKPNKRIAFILRVVEGLTLQEIGEIVGARPAAVGQRVRHAHRELQQMMERMERMERRRRQEERR